MLADYIFKCLKQQLVEFGLVDVQIKDTAFKLLLPPHPGPVLLFSCLEIALYLVQTYWYRAGVNSVYLTRARIKPRFLVAPFFHYAFRFITLRTCNHYFSFICCRPTLNSPDKDAALAKRAFDGMGTEVPSHVAFG